VLQGPVAPAGGFAVVKITLQFAVPAGHKRGDYARLHWNAGSGAVDYDTPVDNAVYPLFVDGGLFGFGLAPFGRSRFGHAHASRCPGFGRLPFGRHPFGHGTGLVAATHQVSACDTYTYGVKLFDSAGNAQAGSPAEIAVTVHTAPPRPAGLKKVSYDADTQLLTLEVP